MIFAFASFAGGLIVGFGSGPVFASIMFIYVPVFLISIFLFGGVVKNATVAKFAKVKDLQAHTEETLSALRLIFSFAREDVALKKYD
jgi:ABC-type multidrug transport system fused ATPase/permease subunit